MLNHWHYTGDIQWEGNHELLLDGAASPVACCLFIIHPHDYRFEINSKVVVKRVCVLTGTDLRAE